MSVRYRSTMSWSSRVAWRDVAINTPRFGAAEQQRPGGLEHSEGSCGPSSGLPRPLTRPRSLRFRRFASEGPDVLCFVASAAHSDVELDCLALFEVAVALALDGRVVDEDVRPTGSTEEPITLVAVEPLHSPCHHNASAR